MAFRIIHERHGSNGSVERSETRVEQQEIVLGRGGESDVILVGQRIGIEHARFAWEGGALAVLDLGSLAGIRVNGRRVARAALADGDVVSLGDIEARVRLQGQEAELTLVEGLAQPVQDQDLAAKGLAALGIESHVPPMRMLSLAAAVLVSLVFLALPIGSGEKDAWSTGPVSRAHQLIEEDCGQCHAKPFQPVQDAQCLTCHHMTEHAKGIGDFNARHPALQARCAQCHMEHNGDSGVITHDSRQCSSCHARMASLQPGATAENVPSFDLHPQFKISVPGPQGTVSRVSLDDQERAVDSSRIKLNHKLHLKRGLRGKEGPVTLECGACHRLGPDFRQLEPIRFDKHCRDCHSLGFDERLPYEEVPHGDAESVFESLFAAYSKVVLLKEDESVPNPAHDSTRDMPGSVPGAEEAPVPQSIAAVLGSARDAEKQLFTKTACFLCHSIAEKPSSEQTVSNAHYSVVEPNIPSVWFPQAHFSHGAHEKFTCESCHEKARGSSETKDLLLPRKQLCQECHRSEDTEGFVRSDCTECHSYHDSLGFPGERKEDIASYLKSLTR